MDALKSWDPSLYESNSHFQYNSALEILHSLPKRSNCNILDIGCGDGKVTQYIASYFEHSTVTGLDTSDAMVQFAHTTYAKDN